MSQHIYHSDENVSILFSITGAFIQAQMLTVGHSAPKLRGNETMSIISNIKFNFYFDSFINFFYLIYEHQTSEEIFKEEL